MIAEPHKANSLQRLIHLQMIFIKTSGQTSKPPPKPLSGFQRDQSRKPPPSPPKKPFKKYDGPVYVPAEVYKLLSPEAVTALKKYNTEAMNK